MNVASTADQITPISVGSLLPDGPLVSMDGSATTLHAALKNKAGILIFYRGSW